MLCGYLVSQSPLKLLQLSETLLVDESNLLLALILGNLLVEVAKPEHDARLVKHTLLVNAFVVLVFVESAEHRGVHLGWTNCHLIRLFRGSLDLLGAIFPASKSWSLREVVTLRLRQKF